MLPPNMPPPVLVLWPKAPPVLVEPKPRDGHISIALMRVGVSTIPVAALFAPKPPNPLDVWLLFEPKPPKPPLPNDMASEGCGLRVSRLQLV